MISNQILQKTIDDLSEIIKTDFAVMDPDGEVLATTFEGADGFAEGIRDFIAEGITDKAGEEIRMYRIMDEGQPEFVVIVNGADDAADMAGRIGASGGRADDRLQGAF